MFDVKPSLLRYWEQEFDILKPHRNKKGNRLYRPQDVDNIKVIYHLLKERKMKIEVARKYIKTSPKEAGRDAEITERLMSIRSILMEIKNDLTYDGEVVEGEHAGSEVAAVPVTEREPAKAKKEEPAVKTAVLVHGTHGRKPAAEADKCEPGPKREPEEVKPPFEEQPLFELAPPEDFGSVDDAMDAFIAKHYDEEGDENIPEADPFAEIRRASVPGEEKEENRRPTVIEQTLF